MPIIITSRQAGFRRCGIAHTTEAKEHADDAFNKAQLAQLQAEPLLHVAVTKPTNRTNAKTTKE